MKKLRKLLSVILSLSLIIGVISGLTLSASALNLSAKYPAKSIKGYIMSTGNRTAIAYSDSALTKRVGYIYASDDCTIQKIFSNNVVEVRVPWSGYRNGRVVYTRLSYFFQNTSSTYTKTATARSAVYNRGNLSKLLGYVYVNDLCYIVGESGNYYQALIPWTGGIYRLGWVNKSAFNTASSNTPSGNVPVIKGVRLYEYPIGSKVPANSYYFNINGKRTYVGGETCYGYCCYVEQKLYGSCYHTNRSHFPNLSGSEYVRPNATQLKSLINRAGVGAHLRTMNGHSMIIYGITDNGFYTIDANYSNNRVVQTHYFTWSGFLSDKFGRSGIEFIEIHV